MLSLCKNTIVGERSDSFTVSPLRFLIMALCLFMSLRAESRSVGVRNIPADTSKNKYDLNDPRNPNCPCHKYQNLANQEYSNVQMQQGNYVVNNTLNNHSNEEVAEYDNSSYSYHHVFNRRHHYFLKESKKYLNRKYYKMKGKWRKKYCKKKRASVIIVACFDWN